MRNVNPEIANAVCCYCQQSLEGRERFLLVDESLEWTLSLCPTCAIKLSRWSPALAAGCNEFWDDIAVREKKRNL
jgi:hypothetical protein